MAASRRKQDDKNLEILRELISVNGNKYCLDCNQRGPTYVNTTIGSFVCSKCSGMLRGLTPPHRVKSISMATFTQEEMEFIKARGNDFCRRVWLGLYEGESVNYADEQSVKDFMSDKYEKKRYYLESSPNSSIAVTNGNLSAKNKVKSKSGSGASSTGALISISPQTSKIAASTGSSQASKIVNNLLPTINETSHKLARPVNNFVQPFMNNTLVAPSAALPTQPSVPDFPVDFSTADIYNSSHFNNNNNNNDNNNINNNFGPQQPAANNFNHVNPPTSAANDRYAALADLDLALRQQNMKNLVPEESCNVNKNPFQSATTGDVFGNKNPFFNGSWNPAPAPAHVNPFMPSSNSGGYVHSNNPFL